jgi:hypothetical protein
MPAAPSEFPSNRSRPFPAILWATLIAGTLDITSAFIIWAIKGIDPIRGLQIIATGLLGREAYQGGIASAALGLAAHFFIVFVAASLFYFASRKLPVLIRHAIVAGLAYGVAIHCFMIFVVLPLAGFKGRQSVSGFALNMAIVMVLVGLPIALIVRRYSAPPPNRPSSDNEQLLS